MHNYRAYPWSSEKSCRKVACFLHCLHPPSLFPLSSADPMKSPLGKGHYIIISKMEEGKWYQPFLPMTHAAVPRRGKVASHSVIASLYPTDGSRQAITLPMMNNGNSRVVFVSSCDPLASPEKEGRTPLFISASSLQIGRRDLFGFVSFLAPFCSVIAL